LSFPDSRFREKNLVKIGEIHLGQSFTHANLTRNEKPDKVETQADLNCFSTSLSLLLGPV
jgi:hypothetical protein